MDECVECEYLPLVFDRAEDPWPQEPDGTFWVLCRVCQSTVAMTAEEMAARGIVVIQPRAAGPRA